MRKLNRLPGSPRDHRGCCRVPRAIRTDVGGAQGGSYVGRDAAGSGGVGSQMPGYHPGNPHLPLVFLHTPTKQKSLLPSDDFARIVVLGLRGAVVLRDSLQVVGVRIKNWVKHTKRIVRFKFVKGRKEVRSAEWATKSCW